MPDLIVEAFGPNPDHNVTLRCPRWEKPDMVCLIPQQLTIVIITDRDGRIRAAAGVHHDTPLQEITLPIGKPTR